MCEMRYPFLSEVIKKEFLEVIGSWLGFED